MIELEKPGHILGTREGHPRVAVTHAAFQVAEWKDYINRHYDLIKRRYPGIPGSYTTALIIGREPTKAFGESEEPRRYLALVREQLSVDEVLTYDDLVHKARAAVAQLQTLAEAAAATPQFA